MAVRISNPAVQHFDKSTDAPLAGGQMFFFESGTTMPKDTFADTDEVTTNANPVILDGNGFEPDIFGNGSYRVVLQNSDGVQQFERDPTQFTLNAGIGFSDWDAAVTYAITDIVRGSDLLFYIAIDTSMNVDPAGGANPAEWSQFDLVNRYNLNENYVTDDVIRGSDGIIYTAVQNSVNQDPINDSTATFWKMFDNIRIDGNSITSTDANGDIDLTPDGTGSLTSGGELIGLAEITVQTFITGAPTWIRPANVKFVLIKAQGGGGGGGSSSLAVTTAGQGGGAGGYVEHIADVTATASLAMLIGTGGPGGAAGGDNNGIPGGGTLITGLPTGLGIITAGGGGFGAHGSSAPNVPNGGTSTGEGQLYIGNSGQPGFATLGIGGVGGDSLYGGVQPAVTNSAGNDALSAGSAGNGGGATAAGSLAGGNGFDGQVVFFEFR